MVIYSHEIRFHILGSGDILSQVDEGFVSSEVTDIYAVSRVFLGEVVFQYV